MKNIADFSVRAGSRYPNINWDYDAKIHRYTDRYLHPTYVLRLNADPGETTVYSESVKGPRGKHVGKIAIKKLNIPDDVVAYDWTVTNQEGSFEKHVSTPVFRSTINGVEGAYGAPYELNIEVPKPGVYDIHLEVRDASGGGPTHDERFNLRDFLVVSIGDSYASGEGNPDQPGKPKGFQINASWWEIVTVIPLFFEVTKSAIEWGWNQLKECPTLAETLNKRVGMDPAPRWLEENAHRSLMGGPAVAARLLEHVETGDLVSFISFARSGAEVDDGLFGPRTEGRGKDKHSVDGWIGDVGELAELRQLTERLGSRPIDALVISIGGNDAGFSGRLRDLVEEDSAFLMLVSGQPPRPGDPGAERRGAKARFDAALDRLSGTDGKPGSLDRLADALRDINIRQVYITEYPTAFFDRTVSGRVGIRGGCEVFSPGFGASIDKADAELMKASAERLNEVLKAKANDHGWVYVGGVAGGFTGHGYCMDHGRYFVRTSESLVLEGDADGTMHPNAYGHRVYGDSIVTAIRAQRSSSQPSMAGELSMSGSVYKLKPHRKVNRATASAESVPQGGSDSFSTSVSARTH